MKKFMAVLLVGVLVALAVFIFNKDKTAENQQSLQPIDSGESMQQAEDNQIMIDDFAFTPTEITVKKGTTLTWINTDTAKHDINFSDDMLTDGPLLEEGASYSYTFTQVGRFDYTCTPHPFMKATVIVTE